MPSAMPSRPVTVAVIDDHPVVLDGVRAWLSRDPDQRVKVVAAGGSIEEVVNASVEADVVADVLLLDLNLHGNLVTDQVAALAANGHRVVVFSQDTDEHTIMAVLEAGAHAYLTKNEGPEHCLETILAAAMDRPHVTPSVAGAIIADRSPSRPSLSAQELRVLTLWFQSMSIQSVARRMGISEHTVRQYIRRARLKYANAGREAPTKAALLARAIEDGLIRPEDVHTYRSRAAEPGQDQT